MKLIRAVLVLLALASSVSAAERTFVRNRDVTSTSFEYCATSDFIPGLGRLSTSGSSATVTATGAGAVLTQLVAGDEIFVIRPSFAGSPTMTTDRRLVLTTPTTNTTMTLTAVADWTGGFAWKYRQVRCGTGAEDGWIMTGESKVDVEWSATTINATSVSFRVQCRNTGDSARPANTVYPAAANSASTDSCLSGSPLDANDGDSCRILGAGIYSQCRCGIKVNTDTGVQDLSCFLTTQDPNIPGAR